MKLRSVLLLSAMGCAVPAFAQNKKAASAPAPQPETKKPLLKAADDGLSGQGYGMAGCGLGSIVLGQSKGIVQIFAATINGTFGSQTFGITTGTSNCNHADQSASLYIDSNRVALSSDMSRGQGETISGLAKIYGCQDESQVGEMLKQNFNTILPSGGVSTEEIRDSIRDTLKTNAACTNIG